MRDRHTDKLGLQALRHGAYVVVNNVCRLVMDPERFPDDADEVAARHGMGAVYTHTHDGHRLRREDWTEADRQVRIDEFYYPYESGGTDCAVEYLVPKNSPRRFAWAASCVMLRCVLS